ncbi:MAG: PAS domain-containing protein [Marinicaulis sp.]|nr:PAS domain-containing protein [Marinicaulis sp.]
MDALPDAAAIISADGVIRHVNRAWCNFSRENNGDQSTYYLGVNYFAVCDMSAGKNSKEASAARKGLNSVFSGSNEFRTEYPCHSPSEKRWFELVATPLRIDDQRLALILHRNITTQKLQANEAIEAEQSVKNLAAIVATMPDAVVAFDLSGRITNWNQAAANLYGYERNEVIGKSMEIIYPPDWPQSVGEYIEDIVANGRRRFEVERQTKTGQRRIIDVTAAPFYSVKGEIVGVSNINRDITEENRLQRRFRAILDNLFAFVGVLEPDGTLTEANRAPLEAAGLDDLDVIGKKFWDCFWWNYSPKIQQQLQDACKIALSGEPVRYDTEVRIAGDQLLPIDFQIAPLYDSSGNIINLIPSGMDISERIAANRALKTSHDTFRHVVENSPFGLYTIDSDFRIAHVSKGAQKAFQNVRPLVGHDFEKALRILWPDSFASEAIGHFRHTLETGEPYRAPRTVEQRLDIDEPESYDWMIERITMPDGRPGVVCNFYDLSERQQYEDHIRFLMGEVNHRAKNLLTVVMSMARQTANGAAPADFVNRFSQRLLGLSASQDLIVQGNWGGVTLRELVQSQLEHLGNDVHQRIKIEGPNLTLNPAAAQGIGMALHELSTNALKYGSLSSERGGIEIDWRTHDKTSSFGICWRENGGPKVSPPEKMGFGSMVIEQMAAIAVNGDVELEFNPNGLRWRLTAPIGEIEMKHD